MSSRGYLFGPLEKRGVVAGLRSGQIAIIGASFAFAFIVMSALPSAAGLPIALMVVALSVALAFVTPFGRGIDEWIPIIGSWLLSAFFGTNRWASTFPLFGDPHVEARRIDVDEKPTGPVLGQSSARAMAAQRDASGRDAGRSGKGKGRGKGKGKGDGKRSKKASLKEGASSLRGGADVRASLSRKELAALPPAYRNLAMLEVPLGQGKSTIGVIKDVKAGLYTAVLAVRGDTFALLDEDEKERRLQSWADVLGTLTRSTSFVHRIQWIERAVPDDGDALNRYLAEAKVQSDSAPTTRSYIDLLEEFGPVAQQHETFIALQISAVRSGRLVKKAGGGDKGACLVLMRELRQFAEALSSASVHVGGALSPRMLSLCIRNAVDPHARRKLIKKGRQDPERAGVAPGNAWPMATQASWDHYQTENVFHATYWVSEWPRLEVGPDFLSPLMVRTSRMRTVSLTMQPIETSKAQREVEAAHTAYVSDEQLRREHGYMPSERRRRELEGVMRREQELADGFAEFRFAGYVTVTGSTLQELDEACNEIEQVATQSRLELRRLYGEQEAAFSCTLPLCRGLRDK